VVGHDAVRASRRKTEEFSELVGKKRRFAGLSRREFLQYSKGRLTFLPSGLWLPHCGPHFPKDAILPPDFTFIPFTRSRALRLCEEERAEYDVPTEILSGSIAKVFEEWAANCVVAGKDGSGRGVLRCVRCELHRCKLQRGRRTTVYFGLGSELAEAPCLDPSVCAGLEGRGQKFSRTC